MFSCVICKNFIAAVSALYCKRNSKHTFHEECVPVLSGDAGIYDSVPLCPICKIHGLFRHCSGAALGDDPGAATRVTADFTEEGTDSRLLSCSSRKSTESRLLNMMSIKA